MATWIAPVDSETDPDAPLTSSLAKRWDNNVIAMTEGASGAPKVQDGALGSTVTAAGRAWINARVISATVGDVGTIGMLRVVQTSATSYAHGSTIDGVNLQYSSSAGITSGAGAYASGIWRCLGYCQADLPGNIPLNDARRTTIWLRIS